MGTPIGEAARITRARPNSPILSLVHHNNCAAVEGGRCTCDASWMLRPAPKARRGR